MEKTCYHELLCLNNSKISEGRGSVEDDQLYCLVTMKTDDDMEQVRTSVVSAFFEAS
jgi:hypothetical protein